MRENNVRAALKRGKTVVGTAVQELCMPAVTMALAGAGFDFISIDTAHGLRGTEMADVIKAARLAGIVPLARVMAGSDHAIARVLDLGAMGVIVRRAETREEVKRAVAAMRYPPLGHRDYTTDDGDAGYQIAPPWEFTYRTNENTLAVIQIEHRAAAERIGELLAVPGVDVALVEPVELARSLGVRDHWSPVVQEAVQKIIDTGQQHGVATGIHLRDVERLKMWQARGMRMLVCSSDLALMAEGARATVGALRGRADGWTACQKRKCLNPSAYSYPG